MASGTASFITRVHPHPHPKTHKNYKPTMNLERIITTTTLHSTKYYPAPAKMMPIIPSPPRIICQGWPTKSRSSTTTTLPSSKYYPTPSKMMPIVTIIPSPPRIIWQGWPPKSQSSTTTTLPSPKYYPTPSKMMPIMTIIPSPPTQSPHLNLNPQTQDMLLLLSPHPPHSWTKDMMLPLMPHPLKQHPQDMVLLLTPPTPPAPYSQSKDMQESFLQQVAWWRRRQNMVPHLTPPPLSLQS
jgi:hypothetical protein